MKLIIQIPCKNEEETLPITLSELPKKIDGIDEIEVLIINDGSTDNTENVARDAGVEHIVSFSANQGLAKAFATGIDTALSLGADIIVNTDADNQYKGSDIPKLIQPILGGKADMVIGDRQIDTIKHFSPMKKLLQKLGSWVVRQASKTDIPDTTSGFRAYSKEAALQLNVTSDYTYTLETIIQAGLKNIPITHVKIGTNEKLRESRLFKSMPDYIIRSIDTILRIYFLHKPLKICSTLGGISILIGLVLSIRFLYFFFTGGGLGHTQSLILAAITIIIGFQLILIGFVADLISVNRKLTEKSLYKLKKMEIESEHAKEKSS